MTESFETRPFDFPLHVQDSLLSLSIEDDEVLNYISSLIIPTNFINEEARSVFNLLKEFFTKYKCSPAEHFPDIAEGHLHTLSDDKKLLFESYLHKLYSYSNINKRYVLDQLDEFINYSNIVRGILEGAKLVNQGKYDEARQLMIDSHNSGIQSLSSINLCTDVLMRPKIDEKTLMKTGVTALDEVIEGFHRRTLVVWLASTNVGKSWSLVHCATEALKQGLNVLFYTLELEPEWVAVRHDMMLCGMGTASKPIVLPDGEIYHSKSLFEHDTERKRILQSYKDRGGEVRILGMPYTGLTVSSIEANMDILLMKHHFVPDVLIIDYADLMSPETSYTEWRHQLAEIYKGLRQIAIKRNCLVLTASQSNRASIGIRVVSLQHFAEDIQKANIADMVLSLCQTPEEAHASKMRIFCCKNRNGPKGFQILNYYNYAIGQFSLQSSICDLVAGE